MSKENIAQELAELYWQLEELFWHSDGGEAADAVLDRIKYLESKGN